MAASTKIQCRMDALTLEHLQRVKTHFHTSTDSDAIRTAIKYVVSDLADAESPTIDQQIKALAFGIQVSANEIMRLQRLAGGAE